LRGQEFNEQASFIGQRRDPAKRYFDILSHKPGKRAIIRARERRVSPFCTIKLQRQTAHVNILFDRREHVCPTRISSESTKAAAAASSSAAASA
jgi:hypothetical protein